MAIYTNFIAEAMAGRGEVHAIYTDFAKAFDTVSFPILLKKLNEMGIGDNMLRWIMSYLTQRTVRVAFSGCTSSPFSPPSGVPQGSVLGPLLFNIFINDLSNSIKCNNLLFADDQKMYSLVKTNEDAVNLQVDIDSMFGWCQNNEISLNNSKCSHISFSNKRTPLEALYFINGIPIQETLMVKDLGITFDSNLRFDIHIDTIINKSYRMLGFVKRMARNFNNAKCIASLFNSLVRSQLEYLTPIWTPWQKTYSEKIEKVQNAFTRFLFYHTRTPATDSNERRTNLNILSLESRRLYFDMSLLYDIIHNNTMNDLSNKLVYRNPNIRNRNQLLFNPLTTFNNFGFERDIITRLQRKYIDKFNHIDILNIDKITFKAQVLEVLSNI